MQAPSVILAPDLIGRSFWEPGCCRILHLWRDECILPVVNRDLLLRYLRMLRALGIQEMLLRRWSWWFTAAGKTYYLEDLSLPNRTGIQLCIDLAKAVKAEFIIHSGHTHLLPSIEAEQAQNQEVIWIRAPAFLALKFNEETT